MTASVEHLGCRNLEASYRPSCFVVGQGRTGRPWLLGMVGLVVGILRVPRSCLPHLAVALLAVAAVVVEWPCTVVVASVGAGSLAGPCQVDRAAAAAVAVVVDYPSSFPVGS